MGEQPGQPPVGEWVNLLELCERRRVRIHVYTHHRTYDPANGRDRRSLLEDAVDGEYESSKMSSRMRRAAAANAVAGRPGGRIPYGYRRMFDPRTRQLVAQEPEPAESKVVAELYQRLIQGHSLRSIARDFEARGIRTRTGRVFSSQHLRSVALSPVYAALRAHRPTGHPGGRHAVVPVEELYEGEWPTLVPRADWLAVQRLLRSPERKTSRPGRGKHLLSLIARCGRAGEHHDDCELAAVRDQLATARTRHEELADAVSAGTVSVALAARSEPAILADIQRLEKREKDLATPSALRGLIEPGADVARRWGAAPMSARRQIARLLLAPALIGELRIKPAGSGRRVPVEDRVEWWRG